MFDFSQLASSEYFFDKNPGGDFLLGYPLLVFFLLAIFVRGFCRKRAEGDKYFKKSIRKKFGLLISSGIVGVVLVLARFSAVPVFSMRLFLYLTAIATVIFAIRAFFRISREYRKRMDSLKRELG